MRVKRIGIILWVSLFWIAAVAILIGINWALAVHVYPNMALWSFIFVGVTINGIVGWAAWDALMAFTYDMLFPGMDEEHND